MKIFSFDRDGTVVTSKGPVKLEIIKNLMERFTCFAHGNQKLVEEVPGIIGLQEVRRKLGKGKEKRIFAKHPSLDGRRKRLKMIEELEPNISERIVVDDQDLSNLEGWKYFSPDQFMKVYKRWL